MGELQDLWQQYAEKPSPEVRRRLIEAYAPLARYVVERLNVKSGPALGYDDLLGQAVLGLIDAVDRFDATRGIKFETYAYHRIRGAVMDMLREMDWVPRSIRQREAQLSATYSLLEGRLGRPPSDEELAAALGITVAQLDDLAQELALQTTYSLDETIGLQEWDMGTVGDLVRDEDVLSPEESLDRRTEREMLARAVAGLPDAERTVISLYYYEGLTLKEIGRVLGVTESRACQIHGKAMLRLRGHIQAEVRPTLVPASAEKSDPHPGQEIAPLASRPSLASPTWQSQPSVAARKQR